MSFAINAIKFNQQLQYTGASLPKGIRIMNPFKESAQALKISSTFYKKFYSDNKKRKLILGINPGRFGAGLTGIPFTDPKRLKSACGIPYEGALTHEPSSVFIYDMIDAYGGPEKFYGDFYINSPCPLGFTSADKQGREKNYNYYDSPALCKAVEGFMVDSIHQLLSLPVYKETCFCLGTGKNSQFLNKLNDKHHFFKNIVPLEHPRFVMQYKNKRKDEYIQKYLDAFGKAVG